MGIAAVIITWKQSAITITLAMPSSKFGKILSRVSRLADEIIEVIAMKTAK